MTAADPAATASDPDRTPTPAPAADVRDALLDRPVFIVGCPRSGTTWVQRLLIAHPQIAGGQESHFFPAFGPAIDSLVGGERSHRRAGLAAYWTEDAMRDEIRNLWRQTNRSVVGDRDDLRLLVEKSPQHALWMRQILWLLPEARFIHVIRDSRAVVASLMAAAEADWGRRWAPRDVVTAVRTWKAHVQAAQDAGRTLEPHQYIEVRYEDLKRDGVGELRRLFGFLGIDLADDQARAIVDEQDFARLRKQNAEADASRPQTLGKEPEGFYRKGQADSWKDELSLRQRLAVWRYTRHKLRRLGYGWSGAEAPPSR